MTIRVDSRLTRPRAVVFDLFGTLVDAPAKEQRSVACRSIAGALSVQQEAVDQVLAASWTKRHDGRLPTLASLSAFLQQRCGGEAAATEELSSVLHEMAVARLSASSGVLATLETLRRRGIRVAVLSDASADIAEAWEHCRLGKAVEFAVFSCQAGALKPHPKLYRAVLDRLEVPPQQALYCGDGGGDELRGATESGLTAVRVDRRGGPSALAFGDRHWAGPSIGGVEELPSLLPSGGTAC